MRADSERCEIHLINCKLDWRRLSRFAVRRLLRFMAQPIRRVTRVNVLSCRASSSPFLGLELAANERSG